ncbi:MAG: phosphomannomutase/phosphoglucomutase [Oscillospiraceae bacterium]|jgi:phosphomannomutase|nr:phosphomannomutase/phosphoglucomutase [Oscillospiraceae bacterium]
MLNKYWKQFLSGSDIRGIATDSVKDEKINLTNEAVQKIIHGFAEWLYEKTALPCQSMVIAVGHDSRVSAFRMKTVIINSLRSLGIKVYDCSLASTPAMFASIPILSCTAAVQITASHHPSNKNGMKFFTANGGLSGLNVKEILEICQNNVSVNPPKDKGEVKTMNIMNYYCNSLIKFICKELNCSEGDMPLKGLKIVVDAGNGVGGFFAAEILQKLGADVQGSIFLNPDGNFPNHIPNPDNKEAMKSIIKATIDAQADLGVIFDTDVDRVGFVDSKGLEISNNKLIALVSCIILKKYPGSTVVTDSVTSDKLEEFISSLGGNHFRFKRGYNNIISAAKKFNDSGVDCHLAIETSGHAAFKSNNFVDDGAYLACLVIAELMHLKKHGKTINNLLENFIDSKERTELRIKIDNSSKFEELSAKILSKLKNYYQTFKNCKIDENNLEGIRLKFNSRWQEGWCLLRKSVHDPILVLNVESYVNGGVKSIIDTIKPFFSMFEFINLKDLDIAKTI